MNKKFLLIFPLFILIIFSNFIDFSHGFLCDLYYFKSNKQKYYINENIHINASWELDYNQYNEIAYTQIQIFDYFDNIIWNSSKYDEIGLFEKNWNLTMIDLNISLTNSSKTIFIKFFSYFYKINSMDLVITYLETIEIEIMKRRLSCELIKFKNPVNICENLSITARFYDKTLDNNSFIVNKSIIFNIISNGSLVYQSNYSTNESGIIQFELIPYKHLVLGNNIIVFIVKNINFYEDSMFFYEICIKKNPVYVDVIMFKDNLNKKEDLHVKLRFYYFINNSLNTLNNHCIRVMIFDNNSLTYAKNYYTDQFGFLNLSISQEIFVFNEDCEIINIEFFFNGTILLEKKTLFLKTRIILSTNKNLNLQYKYIFIISLFLVLAIFSIGAFNYFKKRKDKTLADITIKY